MVHTGIKRERKNQKYALQPVVQDLGVVEGNELITESTDFTVEDETFEINVCGAEAGQAWGFVLFGISELAILF